MKQYLIFGGSGGIGAEVARDVKALEGQVTVLARNIDRLKKTSADLGVDFLPCDATSEAEVERAFAECSSKGEVVGVVHAVGSILLKPAHLTSNQEWNDTLLKNLTSAFYVVKHAAKVMKGGSILLFSSSAAQIGLPNHEAIAAAKAGVEGLVRSAAASYAARGLRVNAIAPGLVRTPLSEKLFSSAAAQQASLGFHALGRLGEPRDIAPCAAWLVSDVSSWVTGQVFHIDGGLSTVKKGS